MAKKNKLTRTPFAAEQRLLPAVSVIIPMYNAEKYIGECLDSLLAQTFKGFEVIVVDDCSTDSSYSIVESYAEKFGGHLKLTKTKTNSGGGGYIPRNIGLGLSRGDYIFFVDADDFIVENALEVLHTAAKNFDADVVYTGSLYEYTKEIELKHDKEGKILLQNGQEDKPRLTVNDPNKNLHSLLVVGNRHEPWSKFIKREFLIENEIVFPNIISGGDFIWLIEVYCCSKRFLRIPDALYFWRDDSSGSITRKKRTPTEQIIYWCKAFAFWIKALNELVNKNLFLRTHSDYVYIATSKHLDFSLTRFFQERLQLKTVDIYKILIEEVYKENDPSFLMMPLFFSVIDSRQKNFMQLQRQAFQLNQFAVQAQKRIAELENEVKRLKGQA